jgi:group I intron endonuclease
MKPVTQSRTGVTKVFSIGYIYLVTNLVNGKRYVGQTANVPELRWRAHKSAVHGKGDSLLCRAIRKYGLKNFLFEVVHTCTVPLLDSAERCYIAKYESFGKNGYNLTSGGQLNHKELAPSARRKIADKKRALYADPAERTRHSQICKVAHNTPEAKAAHSAATRKVAENLDVRIRWSKSQRRRFIAHPVSAATRKKISEAQCRRFKNYPVSAATRALQAANMLKRYEDKSERAKTAKKSKKYWANVEARKRGSQNSKRMWTVPEFRAKMLEAAKHRPPITQETLLRRSEAQLARYRRSPMSQTVKDKISAARLARRAGAHT